MRLSTVGWLFVLLTSATLHGNRAAAMDEAETAPAAQEASTEVAADSESFSGGCVLIDGQYLEPPYEIVTVVDGVEINGHFVPEGGFNDRARKRRDDAKRPQFADRIRARLADGAWLLGWTEGEYGMLSDSRMSEIVYALSSDLNRSEKIDTLISMVEVPWIERGDWRLVVERCELPERVLIQYGAIADPSLPVDLTLAAAITAPERNFKASLYLLTVLGMAATVFALGTLLSYRPVEKMSWSHLNVSKDATQLVLRSIALLVGLAVLDLVCTTLSSRTTSFWELNPLGAVILTSPLVLGAFKIGATLLSGAILFCLRRYHGAQVASWWLALFCTVLAIRWVTFNSMFMV